MMYTPKFTMNRRSVWEFGEVRQKSYYALWVTAPDGTKLNIWDFEEKPSVTVQKAIQSAFFRGVEIDRMLIKESALGVSGVGEFTEKEVDR